MRGLDPRELVERVPRWCHAAKEISAALQIQQAIKEATPEPSPELSPEPTQDAEPAQGVVTAKEKLLRRDLQEAEALLRDAHRYIIGPSSGPSGSFVDSVARGHLVGRIHWFLSRSGA
jgi:hypothetical protein